MGKCVLICFLALLGKEHFWYLDNGFYRHMTGCKSLLSNYVKKYGPVVTFGDNKQGIHKGFGSIEYMNVEFNDVSYVKGLRHYLLSISQLCDVGYKVNFSEKEGNNINSKNSILFLIFVKMTFMSFICLLIIRHLLLCVFNTLLCCFQNYKKICHLL